jgi:glucans biosynthesis protein C
VIFPHPVRITLKITSRELLLSANLSIFPPSSDERLHALDAVRAFALLLGVILHATLSFMPGPQMWLVADPSRSIWLAMLFFVIHLFRMTLFFLLAGFFAHLLYHRLGALGFMLNRLKRIGLPLVTFWPIVMTLITLVLVWIAHIKFGGIPKETPPGPKFTPDDFPLAHLWFLWVLLMFYVVTIAVRKLFLMLDHSGAARADVDRTVRLLARPAGLLVLMLPVAAVLFAKGNWHVWTGIPTPDKVLYANLPTWVGYGSAFVFGWLLHRQRELLNDWGRDWARYAGVALLSTGALVVLILAGVAPAKAMTADGLKLAVTCFYALAAWGASIAMIGMAMRFVSSFNTRVRYVADASYWIYLMHLPLVLALQVAASLVAWPWTVKYPLIVLAAFALLLASYHLLVRRTPIGVMLNGRRLGIAEPAVVTPGVATVASKPPLPT